MQDVKRHWNGKKAADEETSSKWQRFGLLSRLKYLKTRKPKLFKKPQLTEVRCGDISTPQTLEVTVIVELSSYCRT